MKIWPARMVCAHQDKVCAHKGKTQKKSWRIAAAALLMAGAPTNATLAQQTATQTPQISNAVRFDAIAYKPWPGKTTVSLDLMDNSNRNLTLLAALKDALIAKGYRIAPRAALVVTLNSREESGAWSDAGERTFLELRAKGGRGGGDASARLNIFDSARGGLINQGQRAPERVTPTRIVYEIMVTSRDDDNRIWQAWATIAPQTAQEMPANGVIAGALVESFGKTVRNRTLQVR
ncbi:hypothetical protein [Varunaivibrio sulfuroxidans]|uniref:DUF4136 domain-containing protein n=1 Tax=Varunaivibrio sulfuroxidans TaxID=1773489 RepID=A0A4V6NYI4_9PROT|nr:hypothetical protein [Varunaivibrio sulfuroxidans]TCS62511.1 hypothetical protein EDD55_10556 [Varunaivibrio sulfuroxidans]WES30818.1 hypothetical protein P3M64_00120 [Varunaivibrio sulfuroxidans]